MTGGGLDRQIHAQGRVGWKSAAWTRCRRNGHYHSREGGRPRDDNSAAGHGGNEGERKPAEGWSTRWERVARARVRGAQTLGVRLGMLSQPDPSTPAASWDTGQCHQGEKVHEGGS